MLKKILRVSIFASDLLRLLIIALSLTIFSQMQGGSSDGFFPYLVYISSNALFPLISFFILLKPLENKNYLPLYMAGKTIAVILFYVWVIFSLPFDQVIIGRERIIQAMIIFGGTILISFLDVLSILGAFLLKRHGGA